MTQFYIGQKFTGTYPPAAAVWCNKHDAHIERLPQIHDGHSEREYIIVDNPNPTIEELQADIRKKRDTMLTATDKYMLSDFPITDADRELMKQYRAYLRDYTNDDNWWLVGPLDYDGWNELRIALEAQQAETAEPMPESVTE